jgi:hypothetical protein
MGSKTGAGAQKPVWRPGHRGRRVSYFGAAAIFFLCFALFGSQSPGLAAVLAALSGALAFAFWRLGLHTGPAGVRIVLPGRWTGRLIRWSEIERFEARFGPGRYPVALVRASDQRALGVPLFLKTRTDTTGDQYHKYRAAVQARVDELNALLEAHRPHPSDGHGQLLRL